MTQLTDNIRESILGNIGTVISGRLGITDAEVLQKKFSPTYNAEDLTKLPNFQSVTSVLINGVPSASFSMALNTKPMAQFNQELHDAVKKLSTTKFGRPRREVEKEIFTRLGAGDAAKKAQLEKAKLEKINPMNEIDDFGVGGSWDSNKESTNKDLGPGKSQNSNSFLDEWLARRKKIIDNGDADHKTNISPSGQPQVMGSNSPLRPEQLQPQQQLKQSQLSEQPEFPERLKDRLQERPKEPTKDQDIDVFEPQGDSNSQMRMNVRDDNQTDNQVHIKLR